MKHFIPHVFIAIGEHNHMFTLRKTAVIEVIEYGRSRDKVVSFHVQNLSQKLPEALAKAYEYAKEFDLVFKYDASESNFPADLDEIRRGKRAAREEARRARDQEKADRQAAHENAKLERAAAKRQQLDDGIYPFGKHEGQKIEDHPSYAAFLVSKKSEFDKGSILEYAAEVIETKFKHILDDEGYKPGHRPEKEKTRISIKGKVKRSMTFRNCFDGWNTSVTHWIFIKDENGLCVVAKGSWYAEEGDDVNITASLKAKEDYKGQAQTIVNRVKGA